MLRFYEAPVLRRLLFGVFADLVMVSLAVSGTLLLKYDDAALRATHHEAFRMFAVLAPVTVGCLWALGMYRGSWRLVGVHDFFRACLGVMTSAFVGFLIYQLLFNHSGSLATFAIFGLLKLVLANGSRVSYRVLQDKRRRAVNHGTPVVIYGAGDAGAAAQRELLANGAIGVRPVAFIDDDHSRSGKAVNGHPIVGGVDALEKALERFQAQAVIISSRKIAPERLARVEAICHQRGIGMLQMVSAPGAVTVVGMPQPHQRPALVQQ